METNLGSFQTAWSIGNQRQESPVHHTVLGDIGMQTASTPQQSSPGKSDRSQDKSSLDVLTHLPTICSILLKHFIKKVVSVPCHSSSGYHMLGM